MATHSSILAWSQRVGHNWETNSPKSRQENTEELHKKDPGDLDNHNGAMAHLEPDIWNAKSSGPQS